MVIECLEIRLDLSRKIYFGMTKLECENLIFLENRDIIFIQRLREKSSNPGLVSAASISAFQADGAGSNPVSRSMSS